jgi:uncharacterized protein (DUF488 family)
VSTTPAPRTILTVGHSNHPIDRLLAILLEAGVEVVADVRSSPYSRFAPQYNEDLLRESLAVVGLRYVPMGRELGGRPDDPSLYDTDGHVNYWRVAATEPFERGITRLIEGSERFRIAIMCGEEDPIDCHRRLLVGRVLLDRGLGVVHIRGDGRLEPETVVTDREYLEHPDRYQSSLFGSEEQEWRSIRSVLGSTAPPTSSAH